MKGSWGMEMTLDHPGGPVKSQGPHERESGGAESEKMWQQKQRLSKATSVRSPKPRRASTSRCFRSLRNRFSRSLRKEVSPAHTWF